MSLLIKALDKAQNKAQDAKTKQAQAEKAKVEAHKQAPTRKLLDKGLKPAKVEFSMADVDDELSLSPPEAPLLENLRHEPDLIPASILESAAVKAQKEASVKVIEKPDQKPSYKPVTQPTTQPIRQANSATPTQAANVFSAKRMEATPQNTKLAIIAGAGLIAMLAMGAYYYQFVDSTPDLPMPPIRPPQIIAAPPVAAPVAELVPPPEVVATVQETEPILKVEIPPAPDNTRAFELKEPSKLAQKQKSKISAPAQNDEEMVDVESTLETNEVLASPSKKSNKSNVLKLNKAIASDSASIEVTQSKPQDAVNPIVMRAYEAYNAGKDNEAQRLYKQALQRDGLNMDALLGLGAIATRQGRSADASGWYRKVLELDPKNSTAQAAMLDLQQQDNPQTGESRIKSMLAKSPNDANLHAALGNLYAEQNQWPAAQQAYFDAFRLNGSADNAFNLAVSLDQLGKPKLALPYYQQALQLAQQNSASGIDKAALEARIAAIQ